MDCDACMLSGVAVKCNSCKEFLKKSFATSIHQLYSYCAFLVLGNQVCCDYAKDFLSRLKEHPLSKNVISKETNTLVHILVFLGGTYPLSPVLVATDGDQKLKIVFYHT